MAGLEALARQTHLSPVSIEALAGDVGRRRYFRIAVEDNRTVLGVVYPPEEDESRLRWGRAVEIHAYLDTEKVTTFTEQLAAGGVEEAAANPIAG